MARIRTVKPEFFRNYALYQTEVSANKDRTGPYLNIRAAFAGLFTASDREGRFLWRPEELKLDCLPYDQVDMNEIMTILATGSEPYIVRYEVKGISCGYIPGFLKHQRPKFDEAQSTLPKPPNVLESKDSQRTVGGQSTLGREVERKGKELISAEKPRISAQFQLFMDRIFKDFLNIDSKNKKAVTAAYRRFGRAGKDIMAFAGDDPEKAYQGVDAIAEYMQGKGLTWTFDTAAKWFPDWMNGGLQDAKKENN